MTRGDPASSQEQAVRRFRRHIGLVLAVRQVLIYMTGWAFAWGIIVLGLRVAFRVPVAPLLWGFAALPAVWIVALLRLKGAVPGLSAVRALLDRDSASGGLLMASAERTLGGWRDALSTRYPRLTWHGRRLWLLGALSSAFVLACLLFPDRYVALAVGDRLDVRHEVDKLTAQVEALKEEKILDPQRAQDFKKKLEQLQEEANGSEPGKTMEALDHLNRTVKQTAEEAAEAALGKTEQLTKTETLARALEHADAGQKEADSGPDKLPEKALKKAMSELSEMAKDALEESDAAADWNESMKTGTWSKEQLRTLSRKLNAKKQKTRQKMQKLRENQLIDPDKLEACKECDCDDEGLLAFLAEHMDEASVEEMMEAWHEGH
jgi:hypothetical protein